MWYLKYSPETHKTMSLKDVILICFVQTADITEFLNMGTQKWKKPCLW